MSRMSEWLFGFIVGMEVMFGIFLLLGEIEKHPYDVRRKNYKLEELLKGFKPYTKRINDDAVFVELILKNIDIEIDGKLYKDVSNIFIYGSNMDINNQHKPINYEHIKEIKVVISKGWW